tara:strand:- start:3945 stop:5276 length:1332 start_codon:yes stop_codon:yes gene_type:complete
MALLTQTQQNYYDGDDFGGYQFISLDNIITNFTIAYVGENKIIPKIKRTDIAFHAQRAIQELSFDTFKSIKSQEITLPPSNTMVLPQDYVNYTKICCVDGNGIERPLYPTRHTSNPTPILQDSDGDYSLIAVGTLIDTDATIVLDSEYGNIQVGMIVSAPNVPNNSTVIATSNSGGITTIEISNNVTYTGTETLMFTNIDGSLILEEESSFILENVTWTAAAIGEGVKITQAPNTDVSSIKVGMLVSHEDFNVGTTVVDINGAVITTSEQTVAVSGVTTANEVTFISTPGDSTTWNSYSSDTSSSTSDASAYNHDTDIYDLNIGQRYGIETSIAQENGTYYIDNLKGLIHFSSNVSGKTVILKYVSDGLGTDEEMIVHKFAEEAMYKSIAYAIFSTTISGQQLVPRFKKEKFAAIRQAKLRLSNIKIDELAQVMRGKSKWIKS